MPQDRCGTTRSSKATEGRRELPGTQLNRVLPVLTARRAAGQQARLGLSGWHTMAPCALLSLSMLLSQCSSAAVATFTGCCSGTPCFFSYRSHVVTQFDFIEMLQSGVLNAYLSLLQARYAASKPDGAPQAHLFSTFFFSKLLEGVTLDLRAAENDEDWVPGRRTRSGRKRKCKKTPAVAQPMSKRALFATIHPSFCPNCP